MLIIITQEVCLTRAYRFGKQTFNTKRWCNEDGSGNFLSDHPDLVQREKDTMISQESLNAGRKRRCVLCEIKFERDYGKQGT